MNFYTVHEPELEVASFTAEAERVVFVPEGFSWLAAIFPVPWMIVYRMWYELAAFVALTIVVGSIASVLGASQTTIAVANFLIAIVFGLEAQDLRRWWLERNGYRLVAVVSGSNRDEAERKFFAAWLDRRTVGLPPASPAQSSAVTSVPTLSAQGSGPFENIIGMFPNMGKPAR